MSQTDRLILKIEAADFDYEEVDQLSRQLLDELREADIDSVKLIADRGAPEGTKSGGLETVGMIAVQALPAAIPGLIGLLRAWCQRLARFTTLRRTPGRTSRRCQGRATTWPGSCI